MNMTSKTDDASGEATIQLKLPWHYILSAVGGLGLVLLVLWSGQQRQTEEITSLKAVVNRSTDLMVTLQSDVNLVKWRMDRMDPTPQTRRDK